MDEANSEMAFIDGDKASLLAASMASNTSRR